MVQLVSIGKTMGPRGGRPSWANGFNFYDDFQRPDGAIGVARSGQTWQQVVANGASRVLATISNRTLVAPNRPDVGSGSTAAYSVIDFGAGKSVSRIRCRGSWQPNDVDNPAVTIVLTPTFNAADANYITAGDAIHIVFTSTQGNVTFYESGVPTSLTAFNYADPAKDGTQYNFGYDIAGDVATFYGPTGDSTTRTDSRFASIGKRYATWEQFWASSPATCKTVIHRAMALAS